MSKTGIVLTCRFLLLLIFLTSCSKRAYTQNEDYIITIKTQKLKFSDQGFIKKGDGFIDVEIFSLGSVVLNLSIKDDIICSDDGCFGLKKFNEKYGTTFEIRTGIHIGQVMAGIIGNNRLSYDIWGDTVNIASKLESHSLNGKIQVSKEFYDAIDKSRYNFEIRRNVFIKGKGLMDLYLLDGEEPLNIPILKKHNIEQVDRLKSFD